MDAEEPTLDLDELEKRAIIQALNECRGNRTKAAQALGRSSRWVRAKAKVLGIPQAEYFSDGKIFPTIQDCKSG